MPYEIIHDAEKEIAALIDPASGRALGPTAIGETAVDLLEKFADAHGVDPATFTPARLEYLYGKFTGALTDVQDLVEGVKDDPKTPTQTGTGSADVTDSTLTDKAPPPGGDEGDLGTVGHTPADSAAVGTADALPAGPAADEETPRKTFDAGYIMCPTCDGFRTIAQGTVEVACPTCKGSGEVLAEQQEPGKA
jgi:hypothetical protein